MNRMKTEFKCPLCSMELMSCVGTQVDATDGITIFCDNKACGMTDWGHGKDTKTAFEAYRHKYGKV